MDLIYQSILDVLVESLWRVITTTIIIFNRFVIFYPTRPGFITWIKVKDECHFIRYWYFVCFINVVDSFETERNIFREYFFISPSYKPSFPDVLLPVLSLARRILKNGPLVCPLLSCTNSCRRRWC